VLEEQGKADTVFGFGCCPFDGHGAPVVKIERTRKQIIVLVPMLRRPLLIACMITRTEWAPNQSQLR
jgi:hypothetical protein